MLVGCTGKPSELNQEFTKNITVLELQDIRLYTATQPVHAIGLEHTQISPEWLPIG